MNRLKTLGIDLGTNSLGWCLIETEGEPGSKDDGKILTIGTRIFSDGREPAKSGGIPPSLAVKRRIARGARRRRGRYLKRREKLLELLTEFGMMPGDEKQRKRLVKITDDAAEEKRQDMNVHALRSRALDEELQPILIGRILFQLNQRRGFKSNRKTDKGDNDAGKIAVGISRLEQEMMAKKARTYGEFLYKIRLEGKSVRTRLRPETGENAKGDGYDFYPSRAELEDEFEKICEKQRGFQPELLGLERIEKLREVIFYQRPLKPVKPGKCSYNNNELRLPKAHPLFQEFRLYKEVNELALIGEDQQPVKLNPEQRDILILKLRSAKTSSFPALRKLLKAGREYRFNKEKENRKKLEGDLVFASLSHANCFGNKWRQFSTDDQWKIIEKLRNEADVDKLIDWLDTNYQLDREQLASIVKLELPEGYGRLGISALTNLLDALKNDVDDDGKVITEAAASIKVYGKTNSEDNLNREAYDRLPKYQQILERHIPPGEGSAGNPPDENDTDYDRHMGRITNPTVHIALNQLRRVINLLIESHGKPDRIAIELGRDLKLSDKQRDEINKTIGKNTRDAIARSEKLAELGKPNTGYNRLRLKLWETLNKKPENRVCIYSGEPIKITDLFTDAVDVDHILPYSQTLDDNQSNKIICKAHANKQKRNRAPADVREWDSRYVGILARTKALPTNMQWRFGQNAMQQFGDQSGFLARQLTDMQYISRMALTYLSALYPAEEADLDGVLRRHSRVRALPGRMTEMLRRNWSLNDILHDHNFSNAIKAKNRKDHRHHAIDAAVIACTSRALIKQLSDASAKEEDNFAERVVAKVKEPWAGFRNELREKVLASFVSHKPDHGTVSRSGYAQGKGQTAGRLHNDTAYGPTNEKDENGNLLVVRRKLLSDFKTKKHIEGIRDDNLRNTLLEVTDGMSDKDFENILVKFSNSKNWNGSNNSYFGLRHIRILEVEYPIWITNNSDKPFKGYLSGSNYRFDVWELQNGKWDADVISMYAAHQPGYVSPIRAKYHNPRKVLSLMIGDMVAYEDPHTKGRVIARVRKFDQRNKQLYLDAHHETGELDKRHKDENDPFRSFNKTPNGLRDIRARQIRMDELGRIFDPGPRS